MRKVTMREFKSSLEDEGLFIERTSKKVVINDSQGRILEDVGYKNGLWVEGLRVKIGKNHSFCEFSEIMNGIPIQNAGEGDEINVRSQNHKYTKIQDFETTEEKVN